MAENNKLFKGFKQILHAEGLSFEPGYLYFVRTSTGKTDGYLVLNGKKYGTAEEAKALIAATKAEILGADFDGTKPNTIAGLTAAINELADIVGSGFTGETDITKEVAALKATVETLTGGDSSIDARIQSAITALNLSETYEAKGAAENALTEANAYTDKAVSGATTRITVLEGKAHEHANANVLSGITADKVSKWDQAATDDHTHTNKTVLDGITADKVAAWDAAQVNKIEAISVNGVDATIEGKKATVTIPDATTSKSGVMSAADKSKLDGIAAGAEVNYIKSVGDNLAVDAAGILTVTIPEAEVIGVSESSVNGLKLELKDKKVTLVDDGLANTLTSKNVTVRKKSDTTDDQCVYEILQGETVVGTINHPKDMVVTGGEVIVASTEEGLTQGEKYLKLTIANQEKPVYIAVKDLVDVYTAGNGIEISNTNAVSVKTNNGNSGVTLSADKDGLKASIMIVGDDVD